MRSRFVLVAIAMLVACDDDSRPAPVACVGTCIADPTPHCVQPVDCVDSADCPAGLVCASAATASESTCRIDADVSRLCRWRSPDLDTAALGFGFGVRSMRVSIQQPNLDIEWTLPSGAQHVACAVFTCNPVFRDRLGDPNGSSPTGEPLSYIANAEACIREFAISDSSRLSVPLGDRHLFPDRCVAVGSLEPVIDFVAAGCWAYDDHEVIAASDLVEIAPEEYARVADDFEVNLDCATDGVDCFDADRRFFGRCSAGSCQPPCTSAEDCDLAAQALGEPPSETCDWECRPREGGVAGDCVRR
jgi:hypothetical protein